MKLKVNSTVPSQVVTPTSMNFFGKLFQIRDQIHLTHLSVSGSGAYAAHKALNEFYDDLLDLIDTLVESYQGKYGVININVQSSSKVDPISTLRALASLTDGGPIYNTFKETWIQNQIDEISTLTYQTLYKLENLH